MSGVFGENIKISIFGESHGGGIGVTLHGLPSGIALDMEAISREMARRGPGGSPLSTARSEADEPEILSGYFNGFTTGTPLTALIRNRDTRSRDYAQLQDTVRPGHADYTGAVRYAGFQDYRGGGHFSGRITAPLVFAGAVCKQILKRKGVVIGAHILSIHAVQDRALEIETCTERTLEGFAGQELPVLDAQAGAAMREAILSAKKQGDSVGGVIECAVVGLAAGIGDPFFDSVESVLSHILFAIPGVKGVAFGDGFAMARQFGSQCNDPFYYDEQGRVRTRTNVNGGVNGGITNGMPLCFQVACRPTASIAKEQDTVSLEKKQPAKLIVHGRHDPCIVPRAVPVVEAAAAIAILDMMGGRRA
ncbi:chorismate synthase [Luoshenia tenuis]|jgi:chorismate synthase|uniref:chorismate synthase n=1 Tax=Luoshenia tenuis TaxID=2763654 RepID=UPI003D8ADA9E